MGARVGVISDERVLLFVSFHFNGKHYKNECNIMNFTEKEPNNYRKPLGSHRFYKVLVATCCIPLGVARLVSETFCFHWFYDVLVAKYCISLGVALKVVLLLVVILPDLCVF